MFKVSIVVQAMFQVFLAICVCVGIAGVLTYGLTDIAERINQSRTAMACSKS